MVKEIRPDSVAVYIRWSTDDQGEGTTLEVQREACRNYVLSQGWAYREELVFIDEGYSGGSLKRPALTHLRSRIKDGEIDCVVIFKLDRLSRSVIDTVNLVLREWDQLAYVKSAREPIDTTTAMGKQFFYMLAGYAEWERNVIRERTSSGRLKRVQEGRSPGFRAPLGYRIGPTKGSLVVDEQGAAVVRRIFDLYISGHGYRRVAAMLTAEGVQSRDGHEFSGRSVYEILANRIYIGELVFRKKPVNPLAAVQEGAPKQVRNPSPIVVKQTVVPPLIPSDLFEQAHALRRQRAKARVPNRALTSDHLLTGIARCARCGYTMIGKRKDDKNRLQYYMCGGQRLKGKATCDAAYVRQDALDAEIVRRLQEQYSGDVGRRNYLQDVEAGLSRQVAHAQERLRRLQDEAAGFDKELAVIARDYRRERLSLEEYRRHEAQVERDRKAALQRLAATEEHLRELNGQAAAQRSLSVLTTRLPLWESLTQAERKQLLRDFVADLRVYRGPNRPYVQCEVSWAGAEAQACLETPLEGHTPPG